VLALLAFIEASRASTPVSAKICKQTVHCPDQNTYVIFLFRIGKAVTAGLIAEESRWLNQRILCRAPFSSTPVLAIDATVVDGDFTVAVAIDGRRLTVFTR